jgi:hypothetical protein
MRWLMDVQSRRQGYVLFRILQFFFVRMSDFVLLSRYSLVSGLNAHTKPTEKHASAKGMDMDTVFLSPTQIGTPPSTLVRAGREVWLFTLSVSSYGMPSIPRQTQPLSFSATAVTFIAFLLSFSTHISVTLISSLVSFLAAFLTLIAFAIDIALFAFVHHEAGKVNDVGADTNTAPGT